MTLIDEVISFSRDYINVKQFRTSVRKAKIRKAYEELTGQKIKITCNTCYIEALLTITNSKEMATARYELKKGVLLQAFGDASKTCTNDTLTDELGDWYMKHYPEKAVLFARIPGNAPLGVPGAIHIVPVNTVPPEKIVIPEEKTEPSVAESANTLIEVATGVKKKATAKPKTPKK